MGSGSWIGSNSSLVRLGFREELRLALDERDGASGVGNGVVAAFVVILAAVIVTSIVGTSDVPHYHFVNERGAITVVSAILLSMSAAFGLVAAILSQEQGKGLRTRVFWIGVCFGMSLLAVDELMEFHEKIGGRLDESGAVAAAAGWRGWNDILVVLYGVAAIPVGLCFLPTILRYPRTLEFLSVAFVFFVIHTVIDSIAEPPTMVSAIIEESAKLYCGGFFALAFLSALLYLARSKPS